MNIAIIGPGHIGGNLAKQWVAAGHTVSLAFARTEEKLQKLADELGGTTTVATPAAAVAASDIVVMSVPWPAIDSAISQMGDVAGKIIIDTTNQFGAGASLGPQSAAAYNQARLPGSHLVKSFNTLTSGYQGQVAAGKHGAVAMFFATEDDTAKTIAEQLITDAGFTPVYIGDFTKVPMMEAPRRKGGVYGEAYSPASAQAIAAALQTDPALAAQRAIDTAL